MKTEDGYDNEVLENEYETETESYENDQISRDLFTDRLTPDLSTLFQWYNEGDMKLDPEFQRNYCWDPIRASKLIESIFLDVPIPLIFLAEEEDGSLVVIDGQQRLRTIFDYMSNKLKLTGLTARTELNNTFYKDLEKTHQRKLKQSSLNVVKIKKESHQDIKFDVFERINSGALKLNYQEIRNCVYRGNLNNLLAKLSKNEKFLLIRGKKEPDKRMNDRELILRFFALSNPTIHYKGIMKRYFDNYMEKNKNLSEAEANELEKLFKKSIELSYSIFGNNTFRRYIPDKKTNWSSQINKALFDTVMLGFIPYQKSIAMANADLIRSSLIDLMSFDDEFSKSIVSATNDRKSVEYRIKRWSSIMNEICNVNDSPRLFDYKLKEKLWNSDNKCALCGNKILTIDDAQVDHIKPYSKGGRTEENNAQIAHRICNIQKGDKETYSK